MTHEQRHVSLEGILRDLCEVPHHPGATTLTTCSGVSRTHDTDNVDPAELLLEGAETQFETAM